MMNLFANNDNTTTKRAGANQLPYTVELTNLSDEIARKIMNTINSEERPEDVNEETVAESFKNNDVMDEQIIPTVDVTEYDERIEFLRSASEEELDKMLKSQQSKRSRAKSGNMTMDNYMKCLSAAVAEMFIRDVAGKPKNATSASGAATMELSEEMIKIYTDDQELLKKAIRNVQSKKSIMKAKAGFDETSEEWQALLDHEATLKSLRTGTTTVVKVSKAEEEVRELLETVDNIDQLKAADSKDLLAKIKEILATN